MTELDDPTRIPGDPSIELVLDLAQPAANDHALDYGAAVGALAFMLAPMVHSVRAVDDRAEVIDEGKRLTLEVGTGDIEFSVADLYRLPFADDTFDLVVTRNSFHRFREPGAALREMARVARPGGRVVVSDIVVTNDLDRPLNELARLTSSAHCRHHRHQEYLGLFEAVGLTVTDERRARQTVDLDYWLEAAAVDAERSDLVRTRLQEFPIKTQVALDLAVSDEMVSFTYDVIGFRLTQ